MRSRGVVLLLAALGLCLLTSSCGGRGVAVSRPALDDFRVVTRLDVPSTVELSGDEVTLLASRASVSEDVVRDVAPALHEQPAWKTATTQLRELMSAVPEDVRSGTLDLACQVIQGDIQTEEQLVQALMEQFGSATRDEAVQVVDSFSGYYNDMTLALEAGDESAAAVVLSCYLAEVSSG